MALFPMKIENSPCETFRFFRNKVPNQFPIFVMKYAYGSGNLTLAGLSAAHARGRVGGRKSELNEKQIREIKTLLADPAAKVADLAKRYKVSRVTLYKHVGVVNPINADQD